MNHTLSGPPVSIESTCARPSQKTRRYTVSRSLAVERYGLAKVLSVLTGGPDKFLKEFPDQVNLGEIWPRKGMRFSEAGGRFSYDHISRVTCFFSDVCRGPVAEPPPKHCVKETWVDNGLDGVFCFFRIFSQFSLPSSKNEKVYLF